MSTIQVFKKVRVLSDGNAYPLFIDKHRPFAFGEWMQCGFYPTKGFAPRSCANDADGNPIGGWHCCLQPVAPHIADTLSTGERRVWMLCDADGAMQKYNRPESQGGAWMLAERLRPIRLLTDSEVQQYNAIAS